MEIHPPHRSITSLKTLLIELGTITLGVLIALSLEGAREWNHNRTLANEARETIVRELTSNRKAIAGDLAGAAKRKDHLDTAMRFADDLLKAGKTGVHQIDLGANYGDLSAASWQTAGHIGALGHMTYQDIQKYAAVYALQDLYQTQQRRSLEHMSEAMAVAAGGDPEKASRPELERFRQQVQTMVSDLFMEQQLGKQLSDRYDAALKE
jgi:hypothetical protein